MSDELLARLLEERLKGIADDVKEIKSGIPPILARVDNLESSRDRANGMWYAIWTILTLVAGFLGIHVAKH